MSSVRLAFEQFGEHHTGTPLLILPGFFASIRNWRTIARKLAEQHAVLVLDIRNHGTSPHHAIMDYPTMSDDLHAFMHEHQISKAHLLGHSMGGKIAMWFALHHPELVDKLLIADISPVSYSHSFDNLIQALQALPLSNISNRKQADIWLADHISDADYRQFLLQNLQFQNGQYFWQINLDYFLQNAPLIIAFPDTSLLPPYPATSLFLVGERSSYLHRDAVLKLFPNSTITAIPRAGHWLHVEAPLLFCQAVQDWLSTT